jgi:hypothetical protein
MTVGGRGGSSELRGIGVDDDVAAEHHAWPACAAGRSDSCGSAGHVSSPC